MSDNSSNSNSCLMPGFITAVILLALAVLALFGGCYMCSEAVSQLGNDSSLQSGKVKKLSKTVLVEGSKDEQIAIISLNFVIGELPKKTEAILTELHQAARDSDVQAIVLYVNSPGGSVTASDVIYNAVKKAREHKPVVVYMDDMAASGGYYVSCAADHIIANANTLTGSIGVIISTMNIASALDKIGFSAKVYTSGDFKDMLSITRPVREDEEEYIQSLIQETYDSFLDIVSKGRKISVEDLKARNAVDGRIISGRNALKIGLVDANGYLEDAIAKAEELAEIKAGKAQVFRFKKNDFEDIFSAFLSESSAKGKVQVELAPNVIPQLKPGVPYLLPQTYVSGSSKD